MRTSLSCAIFALLVAPSLAFSQDNDEVDEDSQSDEPISVDVGSENPEDPRAVFTRRENPAPATTKDRDGQDNQMGDYPMQVVLRPINLPARMSQVTVALPINVDPFLASGNIRGGYGINETYEIGLQYNFGTYTEDGFEVGKAVALEGKYRVFDWLSGQARIPIFLDPFAMGLTLGAPMQFTFFDTLMLSFGEDLLSFKLYRFTPSVTDAAENAALIAKDSINELVPDGDLNLSLTVTYQYSPNLALDLQFGMRAEDFSTDDAPVFLYARALYAMSNKFDLGARIGSGRLDDASESFGVSLFASLRI